MKCTATTEAEMRDHEVPTLKSVDDLVTYINSLLEREHEYGTAVYAMSLAATAAYNFVASKLGVTGAMAGLAALDTLRRLKHIDGPFMVVNGRDMLYPQCWPEQKLYEVLDEWMPWASAEAGKLLEEHVKTGFAHVHPNVLQHWKNLFAAGRGLTPDEVPLH